MFMELAAKTGDPAARFTPCPPISGRTAWESLPEELAKRVVAAGEAYLNYRYPALTATDYLEFTRSGDRTNYEDKMFARRNALDALVLAECVEHRGRFLDDIINGIFAICEESAWQLPAHNSYIRDTPQLPLPDITRPVLDLFAAETGAVLGMTDYLLKEILDPVSPSISLMINDNLKRRIFQPYLNEHFWWMGDGISHMNNWTAWCTQNVLLAAFTREQLPDDVKNAVFYKACRSLDYFLEEYGEDGCCDEGAQYYRHAGLTLFNALEVLDQITCGAFSPLYGAAKIKNMAAYILNVHIGGIYYVNFADCSPAAGRCGAREYLFGKRTGNRALMAFAASDYRDSSYPLTPDEHNLFYRLQNLFTHSEMTAYPSEPEPLCPDIYYQSAGLWISRNSRFCLAVKAGDNDDSHNHNDVGSFTVYKDGAPMFIDVGVESYTKKTFSPRRYEIWTMQSQYHNLPAFCGVMQKDGEEYRAADVKYALGEDESMISMDIAPAYPDPRIVSYRREARLNKGGDGGITITDRYSGSIRPVVLSLMSCQLPVIEGNLIKIGSLGECLVKGAADFSVEQIPITDKRLKQAWDHDIYRIRITMMEEMLQLKIR